jgi:hypothetical protein
MAARRPAIVADHGFTTGKIAQVSSEKPLQPTREKVGIVNGFGCFPDKMSPAKNTGAFIPMTSSTRRSASMIALGSSATYCPKALSPCAEAIFTAHEEWKVLLDHPA